MTTMLRDCGWCKKDMGEKDGYGSTGPTSAICPKCLQEHFPEVAEIVMRKMEERAPI